MNTVFRMTLYSVLVRFEWSSTSPVLTLDFIKLKMLSDEVLIQVQVIFDKYSVVRHSISIGEYQCSFTVAHDDDNDILWHIT